MLTKTYSIQDCFKSYATEKSYTSSTSTNQLISIFNDFSFTSDSFIAEFDIKTDGASGGVAIAPNNSSSPFHHLYFANATNQGNQTQTVYVGKETSGETAYRYSNMSSNTYYTVKFEYTNGTVKIYIDNVLKETINNLSYLNGETRDIYYGSWVSGRTITIKNLIIKPL